jgi:uncharacterized lipoprotein NlpE involved in copper resistance
LQIIKKNINQLKNKNMKKSVLAVSVLVISLISCDKKAEQPAPCNCGLVQSDNVQDYSVVIQNECSGNNKTFVLQQGDWMNAHVGTRYCITNSGQW